MAKSYNSRASALIIIDMQREFEASNTPEVIASCIREIHKAKSKNALILLVEYESKFYSPQGMSDTQPKILDELNVYPYHITIRKKGDDGSKEIFNILKRVGIPRNFKVCGVNTDCCVRATVNGLTRRLPDGTNITIVADACNSVCSPFDLQWDHFSFGKNRNCNLKLANLPKDTRPYDEYCEEHDDWYDDDDYDDEEEE